MKTSGTIIAINTDPEASIFNVAHYGATCDLFDVAEELEKLFYGPMASGSLRGELRCRGRISSPAGRRGGCWGAGYIRPDAEEEM